jgi:hypothetical protein
MHGARLVGALRSELVQERLGLVRPVITNSQRLHLRLDTPQAALTMSGTLTWRELGYGLPV